jgi:signal transduction histidine kinase
MTYETLEAGTLPAAIPLFEATPGMRFLLAPGHYTILAATDDMCRHVGRHREELVGHPLFEVFPSNPDDPSDTGERDLRASLQRVEESLQPDNAPVQRYDVRDETGRFTRHYWKVANLPLLQPDGSLGCILHTAEDITDRVTAGQLRERLDSYELAHHLFMQAPIPIQIYNGRDLVLQLANAPTLAIWGKDAAIIGKPLLEALPEMVGQGYAEMLLDVMDSGKPRYMYDAPAVFIVDGKEETRYFNTIYQPWYDSGSERPTGVLVFGFDVTEKVRAEQEAKEAAERFHALLLQAPVGVCIVDAATLVAEVANESFLEVAGKPYEAIVGQPYWDAFAEVRAQYEPALQGVIDEGLPFYANEAEMMLVRHGRDEIIWVTFVYEPLKNAAGQVTKVAIWVLENTTQVVARQRVEEQVEQRTRELALANTALVASNLELARSNDNLEEFAYAASHDMKEPIRKIHFFADRLRQRLADRLDAEDLRNFERLETGARRMSRLIDDLLLYSHVSRGGVRTESVDLRSTLELIAEDLELAISDAGAQLEVGNLPVVQGHPRQLQQLFENLLSNALKYRRPGVPPVVSVSARPVTGAESGGTLPVSAIDRSFHLVELRDNGIGFDQEDAERIFNVFTRLDSGAAYRGTGVGLSIVRKVADNHGGFVWAESKRGEGTTFKVLLPA